MSSNEKKRRVDKIQLGVIAAVLAALAAAAVLWPRSPGQGYLLARFENPNGTLSPVFKLKVANTNAQRQKGLMYVKSMPADEGMLFIFPEERKQSFWMKNTYISLDMLFLNNRKKVVGLLQDVPVLNEEPRNVADESKFVVELNAGSAKRHGIVAGSRLLPEGELPQAPE